MISHLTAYSDTQVSLEHRTHSTTTQTRTPLAAYSIIIVQFVHG